MDWLGCLRRFFNICLSFILVFALVLAPLPAYAFVHPGSFNYAIKMYNNADQNGSNMLALIDVLGKMLYGQALSNTGSSDFGGSSGGKFGYPVTGIWDLLYNIYDVNSNFDRNLAGFYNHMLSTEDGYSGYMPKISSYLYNIASNIRISVDNQVVINENIVSILNIVSTMNGNLSTVKSNQVKIQSNIADICSFLTGEKFGFLLTDVEYIADAMEGSVVVKINSISGNVFGIKSSVDGLYSFFTGEKFGFLLDDVEYIADAMEGSVVSKLASIDTNLVNLYALLSDADFTGNGAWTSSNVNVTIRNLEEIADYVGNDQSVMFLKYINDQLNDISGQLDEIAALIVIKTIVDNLSSVLDSLQDAAQGFTDAVTKVFPFCIVFLIIGVLQFAASDPVTPDFDFTLPLPTGDASFTLSLSFLDNVIPLIRAGELLIFVILLFANYRKYVIAGDE